MNIFQLLRVDPNPRHKAFGVCVSKFRDSDRLLGWNDDGSPIVEEGDTIESWGYSREYAPFRRRLIRRWLRIKRWVRR